MTNLNIEEILILEIKGPNLFAILLNNLINYNYYTQICGIVYNIINRLNLIKISKETYHNRKRLLRNWVVYTKPN